MSQTIVAERQNLDALLISAIGLADVINDVVGTDQVEIGRLPALLLDGKGGCTQEHIHQIAAERRVIDQPATALAGGPQRCGM
ncbi:hypothetical protein OK015_27695 [Mycobacterium sp. Aquia_216]|uniref:hypothetical protein n=1 Tax=Mycobacterium sp. Aquia_216 TaxID=2991729 RepID=UPI00227A70AE|nr:hypothetical protein [Mycobacterium sp. Aquia_216]WAJ47939.1 hypothetical protein OK015_27695 [Mycobacterium sp. Aquia_216]